MAIDYGPLAGLIGTWKGDKGMDVSPEPEGTEEEQAGDPVRAHDHCPPERPRRSAPGSRSR